MITFKRVSIALSVAALLAGCSSGVKLDENSAANSGANTSGAASGVAGVDLTGSQIDADGGPKGVGRVVYFDFDSFVVKSDAQGLVDANARFIKADASRKVTVEGHTDDRGGREYNLALGQKRAEAVRRSLTLLGVSDSQVEAVSFGEEKPAAAGGNEAAYSQNRRAEISYR
ncbi:peptidoglycan-associated lipoprotein Pal [Comamonas sp.]|jgi:peptidoglycan-associated lipoprotein|uniref:peptidoglycan-associated lipoprotein Pal n=1 Tax=Comamonas sp. TaxID=34028 RepID=UPI0028A0134E|nr:peptidoglycan-associated lipoprotein Pal [Comamonas sp.]